MFCRKKKTISSTFTQLLNPNDQRKDNFSTVAAAKSLQSCPTLCNPIDGRPPGSPVPGILQARTKTEWAAISFSNAGKWKVKVKSFSRVRLLATPWTAAYQAPPSMGFSRQEYWSGVPLPSPNFSTRHPLVTDSLRIRFGYINLVYSGLLILVILLTMSIIESSLIEGIFPNYFPLPFIHFFRKI